MAKFSIYLNRRVFVMNVLLNGLTSTNTVKIFHFMILFANDMYMDVCYNKLCIYDISYFLGEFLKPKQLFVIRKLLKSYINLILVFIDLS